jgi:hypothetical protein
MFEFKDVRFKEIIEIPTLHIAKDNIVDRPKWKQKDDNSKNA